MLMKRRRNESQARDMRRLSIVDRQIQVSRFKRHVMTKSQFRKRLMEDLKHEV